MGKSSYLPICTACAVLWLYCVSRLYHRGASTADCNCALHYNTAPNSSLHEPADFPHKIWQTSRTFTTPDTSVMSWLDKNPQYRYERITQTNDEGYVREKYAHNTEVIEAILDLQDNMLRADLIQYIFLLAEGGVYTDLDTVCLKPIDTWIPMEMKGRINLVLGIEGDCLGGDLVPGFSHCVQFATWTMMVKPGHFVLDLILKRVSPENDLVVFITKPPNTSMPMY